MCTRFIARLACAAGLVILWAAPSRALDPNDPYFPTDFSWHARKIGLPSAWDYSLGSADVKVAVLDTGVIASTPDFGSRVLPVLSATGSPPNNWYASQHLRHGTWVTSVLSMGVNNGQGGVGVGNFTILPIIISNSSGHNSSDWIAEGIRMAADQGAKVINISHSTLNYGALNAAAAYARSRGALTFIAAGNDNRENTALAGLDELIFVAGTDRNDGRWVVNSTTGATYGDFIDLSAPAVGMLLADPIEPALAASGGYGYADVGGTSYAAPLAAGVAALAWSINPDLTPDQVLDMLYSTAVDLGPPGWDKEFGHGRINAAGVAAAAFATVPEPGAMALAGVVVAGILRRRRGSARIIPASPSCSALRRCAGRG
jgi:subtilisin family serine protease